MDINEETLDGKGSFHVTQMAAFQRGTQYCNSQPIIPIGKDRSLHEVPPELNQIHTVHIGARPKPIFSIPFSSDIFHIGVDITAPYKRFDMTWLFSRNTGDADQKVPAWTGFNQTLTDISPDVSVTGYMPIIPAPAHDMDNLCCIGEMSSNY